LKTKSQINKKKWNKIVTFEKQNELIEKKEETTKECIADKKRTK